MSQQDQEVMFDQNGQEIEGADSQTLTQLGIDAGMTIKVRSLRRYMLFVKFMRHGTQLNDNGSRQLEVDKTIEIMIRPDDDIEIVKQIVEEREGVPRDVQRIIFAGKQLESGRFLGCYGLQKESTMIMIRRDIA